MSNTDPSHKLSIIETAMLRIRGWRADDLPPETDERLAKELADQIRRDYKPGRSTRHGTPSMGLVVPLTSGGATKRETGYHDAPHVLTRRSVFFASHIIAAVAGAAVMWFVMSKPPLSQETPDQTAKSPESTDSTAIEKSSPASAKKAQAEVQVRDLLERWRQAWSRRDAQTYLDLYSDKFIPANGMTRKAWAKSRRNNFQSRTSISVQIHAVKVSPINDQRVSVSLIQDYVSDRYTEMGQPKTLMLAREGNDWRIVSEREG